MPLKDQHGNAVSTASKAALKLYDQAVDELALFTANPLETAERAVAADPGFLLGHVLKGYLRLLSTELGDAIVAREVMVDLRALLPEARPNDREALHVKALGLWAAGDMAGAGSVLGALSIRWPRDLLALLVGHQIDFLTGNAVNLRDRIARALPQWVTDDKHFGNIMGMYGFGLEEAGQWQRGEETGRLAVERNPKDVWGIHAVAHGLEMQGRIKDGIGFLEKRRGDWIADNFLNVHNCWHLALYHLDAERPEASLELYDSVIFNERSNNVAMELLDAAAMLWRLHLNGVDVGPRWQPLAAVWRGKANDTFYAFNDMHAAMCFAATGDLDSLQSSLKTQEAYLAAAAEGTGLTNVMMTREVGLPVCRGLFAFACQDYQAAIDHLMPIRYRAHHFGGSHAQRDVINRTLLEAVLRAGDSDLAEALISERLEQRPASPYNWRRLAVLKKQRGLAAQAKAAEAEARKLVKNIA